MVEAIARFFVSVMTRVMPSCHSTVNIASRLTSNPAYRREACELRAKSLVTLELGTVFADRYEILSQVGRGGMGYVYRARHLGLDKEVALKVLVPSTEPARRFDKTVDFAVRFAREARAVARLDHPGCVRVLDHGRDADGTQYIAMELLDGDTLLETLKAGRFSTARALDIARQLLLALAHAQAQD